MEIEKFVEEKLKLEKELITAISDVLNKYKSQIGLTPCSINIHLIEITKMEDKFPQFALGGIETQFALFSIYH